MSVPPWVHGLLGEHADALRKLVPEALRRAHDLAAAAQAASGTQKRDPYGHTLKNTQHECLVALASECLPGGFTVFRPTGATYELMRFPETGVVLYPWRYGNSTADKRENARMHPSGTRQGLLAGVVVGDQQLNFGHAHLSEQQVDAELIDDIVAMEELRTLARVVIVAYASNPKALLALGWGEADLIDDNGTLHWRHWEDLPLPGTERGGTATGSGGSPPPRPPLRPVDGAGAVSAVPGPRFDAPPLDDDLGLSPRRPSSGEPSQESEPGQRGTGTDKPADDGQP